MQHGGLIKSKRWSYRFVLFLASLELVYVLTSNLLLNTPLLQNLIDPTHSELKIEYDWAYSLIPGRVRIQNLGFLVQDSNIQMFFAMSRTNVQVDLLALLRREFHATKVQGKDLGFFFRFKRSKEELPKTTIAALPDIPGVTTIEKTQSADSGVEFHPWHIRLDGVDLPSMQECWFEEFHFKGQASVKGGFALIPGSKLKVASSEVAFNNGNVTVNGKEFLAGLKGSVAATVPLFDVNSVPHLEIFKLIDGHIKLQAKVGGISFLNYYLADVPWLALAGGDGNLHSDIVVKSGLVEAKSTVEIQTANLQARLWNQTVYGGGVVSWGVVKEGLGRLAVEFVNYEMRPPSPVKGIIQGKGLKITAESPSLDLTQPLKNLSVSLDLPEAKITHLDYFNSYFPKWSSIKIKGGTGKVQANLRVFADSRERDSGHVFASGKDVSVEYKKLKYHGDMRLTGVIAHSQLGKGRVNLSGSDIQLFDFHDMRATTTEPPWKASLQLTDAVVHYGTDPTVSADFHLKSSNAKPIVALYLASQDTSLPKWTEEVLAFDNLVLGFGLKVSENNLRVSHVHATGAGTDLKGWLNATPDDRLGRWLLTYGPLAAGIELVGRQSHLKLNDAIGWYGRKTEKKEAE